MSNSSVSGGWALRAHAACDWLFWVMTVNVLWYAFTLAGGIVLGAAPATIAAAELTRRRLRGEAFPAVRTFAAAWRREFWRSNTVLAPILVIGAILTVNTIGFAGARTLAETPGILTLVALVLTFALLAVTFPLYVHYDLPLRGYALTASRWMLRNLAHVLLLVLAAVVIVTASLILPGIIPFLSLGAWLTIDTALCLAFFAANDRQLAAADADAAPHAVPVAAG
ncbi:YesL family protein [Microbacterium sp. A93]|uniref:YesL family protein n=1 Tax=Microbacterium sp. A93 TaxID=3450716 RepID=UPI003F439561